MKHKAFGWCWTLAALCTAVAPASAADIAPVYKAMPTVAADNYYAWVDGFYEKIRLPSYVIGLRTLTTDLLLDRGTIQGFDPRLDGGGVRGAVGFRVPGSTLRFEFGGSYVAADGRAEQSSAVPPSALGVQFLNGSTPRGTPGCSNTFFFTISCRVDGRLASDYAAWRLDGKAASDLTWGWGTLTPHLAVFGGNTRADQALVQSYTQVEGAGGLLSSGSYRADTALNWTDVGARFGLDVKVPVTGSLTIELRNWIGAADRKTEFSGRDSITSTDGAFADPAGSAHWTNGRRTVFLANAEAGLAYRFTPAGSLRAFAGLNYDGSVPGIAGPTFTGNFFFPDTAKPVTIVYASETSWYVGGGAAMAF